MAEGSTAVKVRRQPLVLVETAGLSEEEWLGYRRKGIGGSDVAALLGISPWRTARDLYFDKLNIAAVEDNEGNWVALEMGHLLEPLVAKIFERKTGYKAYQIKKMFQHAEYPWMLADVDYFVELPDGTTAILEIKTTNYNARDNWWLDGKEMVPVYYESQGRHYMAVMDLDRCFFCCLYGNNEDEVIIREIRRDMAYEEEMIYLEQYFWANHVLAQMPPPYTEDGDLVIESVRRYTGPADKEAPAVSLDLSLTAKLMRFLQLQEQKKGAEAGNKEIEEDMKRLKAAIIAKMGKSCQAICQQDGVNYTVTYNPIRTPGIDKDNLKRLKLDYPDIYEQYVTVSESRRFVVKCDSEAA
ncbi:YqaJ viral recombinase family protein [Intestinimonas butyriciproducens]|uniref:Recombination protein gp47 n=1 Tax=Intestinimonas butyriciproducens TaxID=1297617 RepID=A0A0S2VZM6_9FIRM|nr:YqaJ viral recombinase family protein [Intestinimonas butyriciproducens]ALP92516.1 recombination protein gp47 [Intestinimonas butyriciproducens]